MENEKNIQINPVDWDFIVKTIKRERCVLFLGPEIFKSESGKSLQTEFFSQLAAENKDKILSYNNDGFFLFANPQAKTRMFLKIVEFFEQNYDEEMVQKIAEIPFHTIVSINPDVNIKKVFERNGKPLTFEFFDINSKKDIAEAPTKDKPLLYNLFGSVTKEETLILTHDEMFEYFRAIMGNNILPLELRSALESAMDYVFLGFQFDKWYVQLILSLLKLHDEKYHFIRYASQPKLNAETASLCINHFKIEFIDNESKLFVNSLHQKCAEAGILRNFEAASKGKETVMEFKNERGQELLLKIERQYKLLSEVERKLDTETNPRTIMKYEDEIDEIKARIAEYETELKEINC
jgi:hypothetical protein